MATDARVARLRKLFHGICKGDNPVTRQNHKQFLESICAEADPAATLNRLLGHKNGASKLTEAMRIDLSPAFLANTASDVIVYISAPELTAISGGVFMTTILNAIVNPPFFWDAYVKEFKADSLGENGQFAFASLLHLLLVTLPEDSLSSFRDVAKEKAILNALTSSSQLRVRTLGEKIKHLVAVHECGDVSKNTFTIQPGGRHDNDKADFRDIAILPTADEIRSNEKPFLRPSSFLNDDGMKETRLADYLDNLFRLLREDMTYEMRDELNVVIGKTPRNHQRAIPIHNLRLQSAHRQPPQARQPELWSIAMECPKVLPPLAKVKEQEREKWLKDEKHRWFMKHLAMACLLANGEVIAFGTIVRDETLLAGQPQQHPIILLRLEGEVNSQKALMRLKQGPKDLTLIPFETAVFAYEPVLLALQRMKIVPLSDQILFWKPGDPPGTLDTYSSFFERLRSDPVSEVKALFGSKKYVTLDASQQASLEMGLTQSVSLIQGPPGTGKSFIGALLAKAIYGNSKEKILVVCYTNHALDQFLEDLMDIGIPQQEMVRLGGKSTPRTEPLSLFRMRRNPNTGGNFTKSDWQMIDAVKQEINDQDGILTKEATKFMSAEVTYGELMDYLEFEAPEYYAAFVITDDMKTVVTKNGKPPTVHFLLNRWLYGNDAGVFKDYPSVKESGEVWKMPKAARISRRQKWEDILLQERVLALYKISRQYNKLIEKKEVLYSKSDQATICEKRIIGCTTTAAAKYFSSLNAAQPGVLLVEEAGEILEPHVLTALSSNTKQLILIGDHKQLRPKVNNYLLTVEKGEEYDLNKSLFERLVTKGYPHQALNQQHRMRPEISGLVRHLMYPALVDGPGTLGRPDVRGLRNNVVFIHHEKPEGSHKDMQSPDAEEELGRKASKINQYEVEMVLKILRYIGQQGYGTDKVVILTPYLGQLRALQQALKEDNDPVLNDLDSADLVKAGLVTEAAAKLTKKPIRLATIDNYQGEESDIVIASLTRSNPENNIGFMAAAERVNVLLSRARLGLIMIGNAHTFQHAKKGGETWSSLFQEMSKKGNVYDGLPVRCERHTARIQLLKMPEDFDIHCPDGGCTEACGTTLSCGHPCPSKCHQISDHSKMYCEFMFYGKCPQGHAQRWKCSDGQPTACGKCDQAAKAAAKKQKEDFLLQEKRDKEARKHTEKMAEMDADITRQRQALKDLQDAEDRRNAILQREDDLREATRLTSERQAKTNSALPAPPTIPRPKTPPSSGSDAFSQPKSPETTSLFSMFSKRSSVQPEAPPKAPKNDRPTPNVTASATPQADDLEEEPPAPPPKLSDAKAEWEREKAMDGANNASIDSIMAMTGLEAVKRQVLNIKASIDTASRQGIALTRKRYNVALLGNPGTGKTTVARHYGKFLASVGAVQGAEFVEITGSKLANDGQKGAQKLVEDMLKAGGGTLFVDEAYQLASGNNFGGKDVLDYLLAEMENNVGKMIFIFAGYSKEMEKFFEHNPGLTSRVPYQLRFEDYTDAELLTMFESMVEKKYKGRMKVEKGIKGLYARIAIRRLGRGRGKNGFGNARALENLLDRILERQATRLREQRSQGLRPDDFFLIKVDLIGPDPAEVMVQSPAYKKLQGMIGLGTIKKRVANLFDMVQRNYKRELLEKEPHALSLNCAFLGPPGTGKTTVAGIYGTILAELGLLSNGEVVLKNPSDFIGAALGQSESQTKQILASTTGKVLVIDEAYMLYTGSKTGGTADPYKTAVIDTIVAEVQSTIGEDRAVLLLGYKEQMEDMFQNVNPGLSRRFSIEDAFMFENYSDSELRQALEWKMKAQDLTASERAKDVAIDILSRRRNRPNFGNIGEVENLLGQAKIRYNQRQATLPKAQRSPDAPFEPEDFDPDFNRAARATSNLGALFADVVGSETIIAKLSQYQKLAQTAKERGKDPRDLVPTNFVFKGPPGTGKTTTARKMGQVYYDMGFLSSTEVVECSASDLVGEYVGQTGPKTVKIFEKALSKVLFIDEAYRLSEGHFAKEAMDELTGILTQEKFRGKLLVILAGYDNEMNQLLKVNPGLCSRFPNEILFSNLSPSQCIDVLRRKLKTNDVCADVLGNLTHPCHQELLQILDNLSSFSSWGNARDMETVAKKLVMTAFTTDSGDTTSNPSSFSLPSTEVVNCFKAMLAERQTRESMPNPSNPSLGSFPPSQMPRTPTAPSPPVLLTDTKSSLAPPKLATEEVPTPKAQSAEDSDPDDLAVQRDAGVSDAVWEQLQAAKAAEKHARRKAKEELERLEREAEEQLIAAKAAEAKRIELERKAAQDREAKKLLEQERLRELKIRTELARAQAALEARRKAEERQCTEKAKVQSKLRQMGVCGAGYGWTKVQGGYRCAGGVCFVSDAQLGI